MRGLLGELVLIIGTITAAVLVVIGVGSALVSVGNLFETHTQTVFSSGNSSS